MGNILLCGGAADATVLSNVFIDEYVKDANDAQLKVYLFLVRKIRQASLSAFPTWLTATTTPRRIFCAPSATGKSAASWR